MDSADAPRILTLGAEDRAWLRARVAAAVHAGLLTDAEALITDFDARREEWAARHQHERGDPHALTDIYAVAFGQHLAWEFSLEWCIIEHPAGESLGLYGEEAEIVLLPLETLTRRWHDPAQRSLGDLFAQTRQNLRAGE